METDVRYTRSQSRNEECVSLIGDDVQSERQPIKGLNVFTTCLFVVAIIAGSGFFTLPKAIDNAGWIGFVLIFVCGFVSAYTGHILGKCWLIVQERRLEFQEGKIRYPYPAIGEEAYGKIGRYIVSFSVNFTQFGTTVIYVLLVSENIVKLFPENSGINGCYVALIVGVVMTPFTWFATPKEFWIIAALATLTTAITSVLLFALVLHHGSEIDISDVQHTEVDFNSIFTTYGLMCAAYNGHACFPTFQLDMKNPKKFSRTLILSYLIVLFMYTPSSAAGYFVFGKAVGPNMLNTLPKGSVTTIISVLMISHLFFAIVISINPVSQEAEHFINIPERPTLKYKVRKPEGRYFTYKLHLSFRLLKDFTWKRIVTRTSMVLAVVFVAQSVPHFSSILSLVGGTTVSILAFICPPLFYIKLCKGTDTHKERPIPLHIRVLLYEIVLIGFVAGVATTYSAVTDLAVNKFTVPCYVNPEKAFPQ